MVVDSACSSNSANFGTVAALKASSKGTSWRRIVAHVHAVLERPRASKSNIDSSQRRLRANHNSGCDKLSLVNAQALLARLCGSKLSIWSSATEEIKSSNEASKIWSWEKDHKLFAICRGRMKLESVRNARTWHEYTGMKLDPKESSCKIKSIHQTKSKHPLVSGGNPNNRNMLHKDMF